MELTTILKTLIEEVRENFLREGEVGLPGPGKEWEGITISLARFQSYRRRTEAALLEELEEFCQGGKTLKFSTSDIYVHLDVE